MLRADLIAHRVHLLKPAQAMRRRVNQTRTRGRRDARRDKQNSLSVRNLRLAPERIRDGRRLRIGQQRLEHVHKRADDEHRANTRRDS